METGLSRQRWSSKMIFLFAAIGSAVGLGNVWRFPYLAGKYGGGAFLIPYLIMLVVLGVPLLIMEFAIGQRMQLGAVGSFRKIRHKLAGIGLGAVLCGFVVCSYYAVIMAWSVLYCTYSFDLKWGDNTEAFFHKSVLHLSSDPAQIGFISTPILLALVVVWLFIYFSVWKGVKSVGKVVLVTMPLPIILLIILVIRGLTLPGGLDGVKFYLRPNVEAFLDRELWSAAASQIFFTLSIAFGIMIAYASYRHESSDIAKSAVVTAVTNSAISIVAGFAVFSTLGYMAAQSGIDITEYAKDKGMGTSFVVFPRALSMLPLAPLFALAFFIMLVTLAVDSAFSLVEAVSTVVHDRYPQIRKESVTLCVCLAGFACGIVFTTSAGLIYLDIVDYFITNYGLVTVGLLEALAVGWLYGAENLRKYINDVSDIKIGKWWNVAIRFVIPVFLIVLLIFQVITDVQEPYSGYPQWALICFGWAVLAVVLLLSVFSSYISKAD